MKNRGYGDEPTKYLIHNQPDSDWNITGNKYVILVTDPLKTRAMKPKDFRVRESEDDPMPYDFIARQVIVKEGLETHEEVLKRCMEWILKDNLKRNNVYEFIIESHIAREVIRDESFK